MIKNNIFYSDASSSAPIREGLSGTTSGSVTLDNNAAYGWQYLVDNLNAAGDHTGYTSCAAGKGASGICLTAGEASGLFTDLGQADLLV